MPCIIEGMIEMNAVEFNRFFNQQALLTREEEKLLVKQASKGDEKAKQKLVLANLRYAKIYVDKVAFNNLYKDDLYIESIIGLIKAADHVSPEHDN